MYWYLLLMCSILIIMLFCLIGKKHGYIYIDRQFLWLSSFLLLFFMALRDNSIGIDTIEYVKAFSQIKHMGIIDAIFSSIYGRGVYTLNLEIGYRLYNWIIGQISKNDQMIVIAVSMFIIVYLTYIIEKESLSPVLSMFMYLTLGIYQTHMNVSRNAMAIMICYGGLKYIKNKCPMRYLLCILMGSLFHYSAILFIPLYWLINYVSIDNKSFQKVVIALLLFVVSFRILKNIIAKIVPNIYRGYYLRSTEDLGGLLVGIAHLILFSITLLFIKKGQRYMSMAEEATGTWMFLQNMLYFALSLSIGNATRIAALFGPYTIIYIPNLISKTKYKDPAKIMIVIICIVLYIVRMSINNIGKTIPYQFCF